MSLNKRTGIETEGLGVGTLGRSGFEESASKTGYNSRAPPHCETKTKSNEIECFGQAGTTYLLLPRGLRQDQI